MRWSNGSNGLAARGGNRIDTRIVAATHRNLERAIERGQRSARLLVYRLDVFPIQVPPLRDRLEDVPLLVERFVEDFSKTFSKRVEAISSDSMAALQQYQWPGNVRELRDVVERAMMVHAGGTLVIELPRGKPIAAKTGSTPMSDVETSHVLLVLKPTRPDGGCAGPVARPNDWASSPVPVRRGWPSWGSGARNSRVYPELPAPTFLRWCHITSRPAGAGRGVEGVDHVASARSAGGEVDKHLVVPTDRRCAQRSVLRTQTRLYRIGKG